MTYLGAHLVSVGPRNGYGNFCRAKPRVVLAADDGGALLEAKRESNGHTVTIFRDTTEYAEAPPDIHHPPGTYEQMAEYWFPRLNAIWDRNPADFYKPTNETGGSDPIHISQLIAYESYIRDMANAAGKKVIVANQANQTPMHFQAWVELWVPYIVESAERGNPYSRHVYGGGNLFDDQGHPLEPVLRLIQEIEYLRTNHGPIPFVLGECGLDGGFSYAGDDRFTHQMVQLDEVLRRYPECIGGCMFTLGNWRRANWQSAIPTLITYMTAYPTDPWSPVEIEPPPPEPEESMMEYFWRRTVEDQKDHGIQVNTEADNFKKLDGDGRSPVLTEKYYPWKGQTYAVLTGEYLSGETDRMIYVWHQETGVVRWQPGDVEPEPPPPPAGERVHVVDYIIPQHSPIFEVKFIDSEGNEHQARHQVQWNFEALPPKAYQTKGNEVKAEWEEIWLENNAIYRGVDTSPGDGRFYSLKDEGRVYGSFWCPAYMEIDRWYNRRPLVEWFYKDSCDFIASGVEATDIRLAAHYESYTFESGITLQDVIQLEWSAGETYFYARGFGLVGWRGRAGRSFISEIHDPGARPDNKREELCD